MGGSGISTESLGRHVSNWLFALAMLGVAAAYSISNPRGAFFAVCIAFAAVLVFFRADLGLWLMVALTPLETVLSLDFVVTKALKLGLAALLAFTLLINDRGDPIATDRDTKDPYCQILFLFLITGLFASLLASSPGRSAIGLGSLLVYVLYYLSLRRSHLAFGLAPRLLRTVVILGFGSSVWALLQLTQGYGGLLGSREQRAVEAEGLVATLWPSIERASATFNGPNAAGAFLGIAALIAVMHALLYRRGRWWHLAGALFCVAGVLSTFSRGALLGLMIGLAFGFWVLGHFRRKWLAIAAISAVIGAGAMTMATEGVAQYLRLGPDLVSTSESRVDAWNATFELIRRHPIVGIGFYEFQELSGGIEGVTETPEHSHNGFLKAWVEQGPLGACAYLLFVFAFFKTATKSLSNCPEEGDLKWVLASVAAVGASLFAQELVDANMTIGGSSVAILFATLLALQVNLHFNGAGGDLKNITTLG